MAKLYVLTGGPCCGKTTTIEALSKLGYETVNEAAREVIEKQQAIGGGLLPWINRDGFQREVLRVQLETFCNLYTKGDVFFDRGIVDGIAFYKLDGLKIPEYMVETAKTQRYNKIFILEQLPVFRQDSARVEDAETGKKISTLLKETYSEFGYQPIVVPVMSVEERIAFIIGHI